MGAAETWDVIPVDDHFLGDRVSPFGHEHVQGQVFAMSGSHSTTVWRREESGCLAAHFSKPASLIPLSKIGASLALADLSKGVAMFPEPEED